MRTGPLGAGKALHPQTTSAPPWCSAPSSLRHSCPARGDRHLPHPSSPCRAVAQSGCRGHAGDVKQSMQRPDSSSRLGSYALSILRHLMTNNAGKRVFLRSQEPVRQRELAQGCCCAPCQHVHSPQAPPWKKHPPNKVSKCPMSTQGCHHAMSLTGSHLTAPCTRGSHAQEGSAVLGWEPRLPGRFVGVNLGGDSASSGNGSDGKNPTAKTPGHKGLEERERWPGRLPARGEKPP